MYVYISCALFGARVSNVLLANKRGTCESYLFELNKRKYVLIICNFFFYLENNAIKEDKNYMINKKMI